MITNSHKRNNFRSFHVINGMDINIANIIITAINITSRFSSVLVKRKLDVKDEHNASESITYPLSLCFSFLSQIPIKATSRKPMEINGRSVWRATIKNTLKFINYILQAMTLKVN